MITMLQMGNMGRLGNMMFQYASLFSLSKRHNTDALFPRWKYSQYFTKEFPHFDRIPELYENIEEPSFHYQPEFYDRLDYSKNLNIKGYFQHSEIFVEEVKELFQFKPEFIESVKNKLNIWNGKKNIVLQLRRTDYFTLSYKGKLTYYNIPINFYISALLEHFPDWEDCNIILVSDDLNYCHNHFDCLPNAFFVDGFSDIEQVCLMSECDGFIISNGTFGWWGAWLAESQREVKIIHSGRLFANEFAKDNDSKDFYPERWIEHNPEKKIDLTDCTFTIPVHFDHSDRKQNLDLCVCILQKNFDTKIIIGEQGSNQFGYMSQYCDYMKFDYKDFHRTRMLNQMALKSDTPIVGNWDCDVIQPPMQVYLSVKAIKDGADFCYPYDGTFIRMDRHKWFSQIEKYLDIGVVKLNDKYTLIKSTGSTGGAVLVNKEKFIESGMENENMISFCPEDWCRFDRWKKLDYKIERINGNLYHMNHFVGINSCSKNPFWRAGMDEHDKIKAMSKEELRKYVDGWTWKKEAMQLAE